MLQIDCSAISQLFRHRFDTRPVRVVVMGEAADRRRRGDGGREETRVGKGLRVAAGLFPRFPEPSFFRRVAGGVAGVEDTSTISARLLCGVLCGCFSPVSLSSRFISHQAVLSSSRNIAEW